MKFPHPKLLQAVQKIAFPDTCTVLKPTVTSEKGIVDKTPWEPVISGVPCRVSPRDSRKVRESDYAWSEATHYITLAGLHEGLDASMRVQVNGETFSIMGLVSDGQRTMTRLHTRQVNMP